MDQKKAGHIGSRLHLAPADAAASAVVGLPVAIYLIVLNLVVVPSDGQWFAADPILHILPVPLTLWSVPITAMLAAVVWWTVCRPQRAALRRGAKWAIVGACAAFAIASVMRLAVGAQLPQFVPPEESSAPGFLLSMTAGFGEEVIFRYAALPLIYFGLRRRIGEWPALVASILLTALGFALLHEVGVWSFEPRYFATRVLVPGIVMSLAWFVSPSFIIAAHSCAHLALPLLFASA